MNHDRVEENARYRLRLVLADDRPDVLDEIRRLLEAEFDVLCAVTDGQALVESVAESRPDVVISDLQMPGMSGIEAGRHILEGRMCDTVIVLTMYNEPHLVSRALAAGIRGYVLKVDAGEELIPAVRAATGGGTYLSQGVLVKWRKDRGGDFPTG